MVRATSDGLNFNARGTALLRLAEVFSMAGRPGEMASPLNEAIELFERKGNRVSAGIRAIATAVRCIVAMASKGTGFARPATAGLTKRVRLSVTARAINSPSGPGYNSTYMGCCVPAELNDQSNPSERSRSGTDARI
jgi:hypothetical protein